MNPFEKLRHLIRGPKASVPNPKGSDVYLVSFPKSGNTWTRYLLAYSIWPETKDLDLKEMAHYIPSFALDYDADVMLDPAAPCNLGRHRIIKEHFPYNQVAKRYAKNVIYLVRDGRDAMVSYWHFCNQRDGTDIPFDEFIRLSASKERHFGPWRDHVIGWMNSPVKNKIIVRYEDLRKDTVVVLRKMLDFLEIEVRDSIMEEAIQKASFDEMKKLEKRKGFNLDQLKNVEFVRQGNVGGWRDTFGDCEIENFIKYHGNGIKELGYAW